MIENKEDKNAKSKPPKLILRRIVHGVLLALIAFFVGFIHYKYVSHLFENDRNFSYLSDLEREMSFRTEMGFYYSYYKTIVEERPFIAGITKLMYDKLVEYPNEVNAFNRFNIYPEVMIGAVYRYLEPWLNTTEHVECHMVNRGDGMPPVESCVGLGHPMFFYLEAIWWLAGLTVAVLFLHATTLSDSLLGGVVATLQYIANHAECTRVQWAPNERENLALPLLLMQGWLLSRRLRARTPTPLQLQIAIFTLNCLCLLFWQFSQFIFLTQTAIFFIMEQLRIIDIKALSIFLHSHFCGLHMAVLLLQGNDMLKSSLYASFFLVVSAYCLFCSSLRVKVQNRVDLFVEAWLVVLRILIVILASVYLKKLISDFLEVQDDAHVWAILYSKLFNYRTFHTMIYTCSEVFDFLPMSTIKNLTKTLLIPMVVVSIFNVVDYWIKSAGKARAKEKEDPPVALEGERTREKETDDPPVALERDDDEDSGIENNESVRRRKKTDLDVLDKEVRSSAGEKETDELMAFLSGLKVEPAIFYNVSQLVVFGVMALLVMRLKLLFATQLCLLSGLVFNKTYYGIRESWKKYLPLVWGLCVLPAGYMLLRNVSHEMAHVGEFSDYPQEELVLWARRAGRGAFAASMPLSAALLLAARRAVVAHPHYESLEARQRAYTVYKAYGKFPARELYHELSRLRASYLVLETAYCYGRSRTGCSFEEIWDAEAPALAEGPSLCRALLAGPVDHFYPVFRNDHYAVFRIHDLSVRYMPRAFDS